MSNVVSNKTNLELMNSVLDLIESWGYHIKDKSLGNCYFIFEDEENSVCQFHIKEIPGFLFGMWNTCRFDKIEDQIKKGNGTWADSLGVDSKSEIIFFTQYERDLDKFKPSRSGFVTGLFRRAWNEQENDSDKLVHKEEWYDYELEKILRFMKHHKMRSSIYAGMEVKYIWEVDFSGIYILKEFIKDWLFHWKYQFKDYMKLRRQRRISKQLGRKIKCSDVFIIDRGRCWYPRIVIFIRRRTDVSLNDYAKEQDLIDKFESKNNGITITQYDVDILADDITEQDLQQDRELKEKFKIKWKYFSEEINEEEIDEPDDEKTKIIYTNIVGGI